MPTIVDKDRERAIFIDKERNLMVTGQPFPDGAAPGQVRVRQQNRDMALQLADEEPEAGPWRAELLSAVIEATIWRARPGPWRAVRSSWPSTGAATPERQRWPRGSAQIVPGSAVVHTDDIAWRHSRFGWADLLIEGILEPVHRGLAVSYRPPRWAEHGREGSYRGSC